MVKPRRKQDKDVRRAADDVDVDNLPELDEAGGLKREELTEAGGGRNVERHDRTRDRELEPPASS